MPTYSIQGPDGKTYSIDGPPNATREQIIGAIQARMQQQPPADQPERTPGILESGVGGAKKLGSSIRTAIESPFGAEKAAQAGLTRARALEEETPSVLSLDKVKEKYAKDGVLSAAGEVLSQAPGFIMEQLPQLGAAFTGGRLGAIAGAPLGPYGAIGGGIVGALSPLALQAYGAGAERRAAEGLPQDPGKTALSAAGQAGMEYASMVIPLGGKLMSRILGIAEKEGAQALVSPAARKLAEERLAVSIAKGSAKGLLAEIPTEVGQQMLDRWQANQPLLDDNALKEYSEAAYGASLFGGPFGGVGRRAQVGQAREQVTRADALEAAEQAKKLREEEAARKATPEYALDVGDRFEALQQQEKDLLAARGKKLGKDATDEQKETFAQQTEELQALRNELKALAPDYKEIKAKLPGLREERRISGMSEQDYYYEQMGMKSDAQIAAEQAAEQAAKEKAAPPVDEMQAWMDQTAAQAATEPVSKLQKELDTALDGLRYWGSVTPTDVAEVLADNPALMLKVYKGEISIPEFKAKDVQALKGILNLQMKDLASQMAQGRVAAGKTSAQIAEEKAALQRISEAPLPESKAATQLGLLNELEGYAGEMKPGVTVEPGLQKQNYRFKAREFQETADDALTKIQESLDKIAKGETLDSSRPDARKFASATSDIIRQQALEAKPQYVDAVMNRVANERAAEGQQPITTDQAAKAAVQIDAAIDAFINGQATEAALLRQLDVLRARLLVARPAVQKQGLPTEGPLSAQSNYREAQRVAEERGETAQTLEGQLRRQRDYVGGLIERVVPTDTIPRNTRALLEQTQTAIEDGIATREVLDLAEDIATRVQRGQNTQADLPKLNAALRSMQQAQAPGIEGGQQSLFGTEDLGVVRATAANFRKFLNSKQVQALRALLPKVEAVVEKERTVRTGETSPGVDAEFYAKRIDALEDRVNEAKDSLEDLGGASWESIMETRAVLPEEVRVARQKLVALLQEQNKLEMEREAAIKPKLKGNRPPYAAAQAKTKAAKLKDQIKDKEVSILQSIRDLSVKIREQRGQALYGPIIQKFEQQAQMFEARLAELEASMPEGGRMSPDLDALFTEAEDLKEDIAKARAAVKEARDRQERTEDNSGLLAAADERIVKDKARLAELEKKLANVDFVGEERRAAQVEAGRLRRDTAVADSKLREAKELQSRQEEERKRRIATGEGMQKLTRTVVPVERVTKSGKRIVMKEKGTGLPVQQKKTTGAFTERAPAKGVDWKTTKESKPRIAPTAEAVEETTPKAQRVGAAENLKDIAKTAGTLARQANVTDISPKPKKVEPLRAGSAEAREEKATRKQTAAEKRKLARDLAEGVTSEYYDEGPGLAFRTAKAPATPVDAAEAKKLIVETLSKLPKGVKLTYVPTLEGMDPDLLARLVEHGYKEGKAFKGVVLPDDGTIVVVGDQHTNVKDLEETLFHEMVGHYGIDTVIGMDRLQKYANDTDVIRLAEKLGGEPLVRKAVEAAKFAAEQNKSEEIQKLQALREVIAYTAQARITENFRQKAGRWLQELVGMARSALRQMGFNNMARMSTSDVFYAIKMANKAFNERTVGPYRAEGGLMAFRTKSEPSRYGASFVGSQKGFVDKLRGNMLGLSGRVQFVDQYAALDAAMKKGLDAGVISDLEAEQAGYYLRFGQQANAFATQALTNGPLSLVKQMTKRGMEFVYKSAPGANMVKVAEALEKSGIKNSTELENMFTIYTAGKRAKQVGWNKLNFKDPGKVEQEYNQLMAELKGNDKARAAFEEAAKIYKEYNNGLVDFAAQTGYLSQQKAAELKATDYVPFYRVQGGELQLMVDKERPIRIANIKDEPMLHELVGGNEAILPIFTSSAQNAFVLTRMGLRNQMMKDNVMLLGRLGIASKIGLAVKTVVTNKKEIKAAAKKGITIPEKTKEVGLDISGPNVVRYKVRGEDNFAIIDSDQYGIPAELIVKGMEGIKTTIPFAIKAMGLPANVLRKFITRNPAYAVRQAIRDPLTAWFTTGVDGVPVLNSMKELSKMVAGRSKEEAELMRAGAISSNVMTGDEQDMAKALRDMSLGRTGWSKLMMKADALALQGDAATRSVIYKDSLAKGMSEMQAFMRTLESMNFSRRGLAPSMQMFSTVIPFFNAQIQGLDVLYRAFKGQMPYSEQLKIRQKLYTRGLLLAAGTLAYAAAMEDDEAYKRAKPEERLGNWFVYTPFSDEPMRVPIPFELGYLFKALPEAVFNMAAQDERAEDITKGMGKLFGMANPFALPAAIKPATEVILGKSFFGGDIESKRELNTMMPGERSRDTTTGIAKMLGSVTGDFGLTPIKIDYLIRGYTGGLGVAIASLANPILNTEASAVEKPTMKTSKLPFIGGLFQPVEGRGTLDAAYERILEIQQVQGSYKRLLEEGKDKEADALLDKYENKLASANFSGRVREQLGKLATMRRNVLAADFTRAEKDEMLKEIDEQQVEIAREFLSVSK
jgi:hypothetical protein